MATGSRHVETIPSCQINSIQRTRTLRQEVDQVSRYPLLLLATRTWRLQGHATADYTSHIRRVQAALVFAGGKPRQLLRCILPGNAHSKEQQNMHHLYDQKQRLPRLHRSPQSSYLKMEVTIGLLNGAQHTH